MPRHIERNVAHQASERMTTERFCVGRHCFALMSMDETGKTLLPNFTDFRIAEDDGREDRFCVRLEDRLPEWQEDAHCIGEFDSGAGIHGVSLRADGGYQLTVSDPKGNLCSKIVCTNDFTDVHVMLTQEDKDLRSFALNNGMMLAYSFALCESDTLLVHASVIRHDGRGYLMTAPSGTGKSTHTYLWYKNIEGCDLMNDDNPVIRITDGIPTVYGSPWSGKTPCYRNISAPIGAIVNIRQDPHNVIRRLRPVEAFTMMLPACNNMKWDKRIYTSVCSTIEKLIPTTGMWELRCRPDREAAIVCHEAVRANH